jgi:transposase
MLPEPSAPAWSEIDAEVFERLVKPDHYVRRASEVMDFERFRPILAGFYSPDQGRPAEEPVRMLKLEFLQYHDLLSDRQVIDRAQTDMAYRYFLELGLEDELPHPTSLCVFRGRIGVEGHRAIFNEVIAQAREHGLVRDRLRLKDATHVIADVAIPSTLALIAQVRDKLLGAVEPFDRLRAEGERARVEMIHTSTEGRPDEERLGARVTHLREILAWVDELASPEDGEESRAWQALVGTRRLAHKILADQENPKQGDRTISSVDPDARCGKHGDWYDGYLLDVMMDADSELITAVAMLPANGNEAADAAELIRQEEQAHGNDVEALSMDAIGFQGPVLRELEAPEGLALDVYVPPRKESSKGHPAKTFATTDFVEDRERGVVTCPAGHTSVHRARDDQHAAWVYRFGRKQCATCPWWDRCLNKPANRLGRFGRVVRKTDYQAEYRRAREKANTPEYQAVRAQHPKIERKLSELVRRHGIRRARYRGRWKVVSQALITATVTNIKRVVHLLDAPATAPAPT